MDLSEIAWALVLATLAAVPLSLTVWSLLDAARRPQWAWALAGRKQVVWMAVIMFSALTLIGGLGVSFWYLTKVRPVIAAAEDGHL